MAAVTTQAMAWSALPNPPMHYAHHTSTSHPRLQHPQYHHNHHHAHTAAAPAGMPSYHLNARAPFVDPTAAAASHRGSYEPYPTACDPAMSHHLDGLYTSELPAKKRTRTKMYPSEEARQAAKLVQKARRREQNRNAQRRLRDRKEEHIFKLEAEVAQLRRQADQHRAETQNLEEMIRRLIDQRQELQRKLESLGVTTLTPAQAEAEWSVSRLAPLVSPSASPGARSQLQRKDSSLSGGNNALGLSEYDATSSRSHSSSSSSSSVSSGEHEGKESVSSASSVSISTPRSPSFLSPGERSRTLSFPNPTRPVGRTASSFTSDTQLPRIKLDPAQQLAPLMTPTLLPPVSAGQWGMHQ